MGNNNLKLDFIVIGAPRSATTWMCKCLAEHPDICFSSKKEAYFFHPETRKMSNLNDFFEKYFSQCQNEKIKGTAALPYLRDSEVPNLIKKSFPETKLIACLRNPIERAHSHYRLFKSLKKIDQNMSFEEALKSDKEYTEAGMYCKYLKKYYQEFPSDNILILIYEDINKNPVKFMKKIYDFLGIDTDFISPSTNQICNFAHNNKRLRIGLINDKNIRKLFWMKKIIPGSKLKELSRQLINFIKRKNLIRSVAKADGRISKPKLEIKKETREFLRNFYQKDIKGLEKMINRDLSFWK